MAKTRTWAGRLARARSGRGIGPKGVRGAGAQESGAQESGARPRLSRRRRLVYLSIPYAALLLLLLSVEAGVRLTRPHVSTLEAMVEAHNNASSFEDRQRVTIFEGDPFLYWRLKPDLKNVVWDFTLVSTNSQGLRHDAEVGPKQPGALRVVCLGDSVTFGYRVPVVWPDKPQNYSPDWLPYPMLLQRALRAANPGRRVEVIAYAVPGYTSHQGLAWLRRDIGWLEPDVLVVNFGWNDTGLRVAPDRELMQLDWWHVTLRRVTSRSQALTHAALWLQRRRAREAGPRPASTPRVPAAEFAANMLEIARLAREQGAAPLLVAPVYRDAVTNPPEAARMREHRDALRAAAHSGGVPYLEIAELTEANHPATQKLFGELIHPNHDGHRVFAAALLRHFATNNTLKGLNIPPGL